MTAKAERRDAKRKQREKSRRMRGNRSVFTILREKLKRNRYYQTGTLEVDVLTVDTDEWHSGGSFNLCKHGEKFPPHVRRE